MNNPVGVDSGCLDIAPYETRCASCPRRVSIEVVVGPETQLSASRMGAPSVTDAIRCRVAFIDSRES